MVRSFRLVLVAAGFLVERLRRIPGGQWLLRHSFWVASGLIAAAFVAFIAWGLHPTPLRVTLADLRAGSLPATSSWIIISGDLVAEPPRPSGVLVYRLTDNTAANSWMLIQTAHELPIGRTTVSGTYFGQRDPVPAGFAFIGQMRADPVQAQELPPPWIAILLATAGVLVGIAGRLSYPAFFARSPRAVPVPPTTLDVGVRRATAQDAAKRPGTLRLAPGAPVQLGLDGEEEAPLRLYSALSSIDAGELQDLSGSAPVLRVRQPAGELEISFASDDDRDAAYAALAADARRA